MKELAIIANVIGTVYFMGGMLIQHDKAKKLVSGMERGFKELLVDLKEKQPVETIRILLKIFGGVTGIAFLGVLLIGFLKVNSQQLALVLSFIFFVSAILFSSLFWFLKHKEILRQAGQWLLILGVVSLLLPVIDFLAGVGITNLFYSMLQISFGHLFILSSGNGLIYEASVVSGFYFGCVILFYVMGWLYAAPIVLVAWIVVATPILCARAINRAFPKEPIAIIFFLLWLFSVLYLAYASP